MGISEDKISNFVDDNELSSFAFFKMVHSDHFKRAVMEENFSKIFSGENVIGEYIKAFEKSYIAKISFFFNEIILVILSLVIPTVIQYYPFKEVPIIYAVLLSFGLVVISIIRESNIFEFLALNNQYKVQVTVDYVKNIFKGDEDRGLIHLILFPFYIIKWILTSLHSFIVQFKFQLLFYVSLVILLSIAYQQVGNIFNQIKNTDSQQETSSSISSSTSDSDIRDEEEFKKVEKVLNIPSLQVGDDMTIEPRTLVYFPAEGQEILSETENVKEYSYTAPISGEYYLELLDLKERESVYITVYDNLDKSLTSFSTDGAILAFEAGKSYKIVAKYAGTDLAIRLQLTVANAVIDLSNAHSVRDTVSYSNQRNIYDFIPQQDGLYHFELKETLAGSSFKVQIYDQFNNPLETVNYSKSSFHLKANEKYTITVKHSAYTNISDYTLQIGVPKPVQTITDYTKVIDSVEYTNQVNHYIFKAPLDGVYGFEMKDYLAHSRISVIIQDHLKEKVGEIGTFSNTITVRLEKGQEYSIYVMQDKEFSAYSLVIGYANPVRKITLEQTLTSEMTFAEEVHEYQFFPQKSGVYKVNVTNDVASINLFDKYGNRLTGTFDGLYTLEKDEQYTIQLVQNEKLGSYDIKLETTK